MTALIPVPRFIDPATNRSFYVPGDVVSINLKDYPLWPAIIKNPSEIPSDYKRQEYNGLEYLVQTFPLADNFLVVIPAEDVLPFQRPEKDDALNAYNEARQFKKAEITVSYPLLVGLPLVDSYVQRIDYDFFKKHLNFLSKTLDSKPQDSPEAQLLTTIFEKEEKLFQRIMSEAKHYLCVATAANTLITSSELIYSPQPRKATVIVTEAMKVCLITKLGEEIMILGTSDAQNNEIVLCWPIDMLKALQIPVFNDVAVKYPEIIEAELEEESTENEESEEIAAAKTVNDIFIDKAAVSSRNKEKCCFCNKKGDNLLGPIAKNPESKSAQAYAEGSVGSYRGSVLYFHEECAYYTPDVYRPSTEDCIDAGLSAEDRDMTWFNVASAAERVKAYPCYICKKPGASIGCWNVECQNACHFSCAIKSGWTFPENRSFYCEKCRKNVDI